MRWWFLFWLVLCSLLVVRLDARAETVDKAKRERLDTDSRIRQLEETVKRQARQIELLQKSLEALQGRLEAGDGSSSHAATPATTRVKDEVEEVSEEEEDPGPEPPPPMATAPAAASSTATGQQPSMNPNISVNVLMGAKRGGAPFDGLKDSFFLDEVELALQSPIDPYARADIYISFPHDETPQVEEAVLTWLRMPWGLQLKAGKLKGGFGRVNPLHSHALPQIDRPLVNEAVFGAEGLSDPGVELSWLLPTPWYSRLITQVMSRTTAGVSSYSGSPVDVWSQSSQFDLFPQGGSELVYLGRWENLFDLNEDTTLELGISGVTGRMAMDNGLTGASALGADLTLRWKPLGELGRALVWQSEIIQGRQDWIDHRNSFTGWYSFLNYRFDRFWSAGVRYGETQLPLDPTLRRDRWSFLLEWIPSEWNRLRLQYNTESGHNLPSFDEWLLQWNIVLGPHGVHKY